MFVVQSKEMYYKGASPSKRGTSGQNMKVSMRGWPGLAKELKDKGENNRSNKMEPAHSGSFKLFLKCWPVCRNHKNAYVINFGSYIQVTKSQKSRHKNQGNIQISMQDMMVLNEAFRPPRILSRKEIFLPWQEWALLQTLLLLVQLPTHFCFYIQVIKSHRLHQYTNHLVMSDVVQPNGHSSIRSFWNCSA